MLTSNTRVPASVGDVQVDERLGRASLRVQIARLEVELSALFCSADRRNGLDPGIAVARRPAPMRPRLLSHDELERIRDGLVITLARERHALAVRARAEEASRVLIEEMLLDPKRYRWARVSNADIGESGCKQWHVRPRFGLIGLLCNWWRVVVSSGCP